MNPALQQKIGVLYVLDNDAKSHRALALAQGLPEIYVQSVGLLAADQVPPWLKEVPTCVTLEDRKIHVGTEALELLSLLWHRKQQQQQQRPSQQHPSQQHPPQQHPSQQHPVAPPQYASYPQAPPQQYGAQGGQYARGYAQQPPPPGQGHPGGQMMVPPRGGPPPPPPPAAAVPEGAMVRGSLQPASGTGQYGCSLDAAFAPMEDSSPPDAPTTDPRVAQSGKIKQNDIESYLRLREQAGGQGRGQASPMLQQ